MTSTKHSQQKQYSAPKSHKQSVSTLRKTYSRSVLQGARERIVEHITGFTRENNSIMKQRDLATDLLWAAEQKSTVEEPRQLSKQQELQAEAMAMLYATQLLKPEDLVYDSDEG